MKLKFTKMHGLGNDFIVLDGINQKVHLTKTLIQRLANRFTGIGFDQCLIIEPSDVEEIDFKYRIFNSDGNEVGQCGNGARCLALFTHQHQLTDKQKLRVATKTTSLELLINEDKSVRVNMGVPKLIPHDIPFNSLDKRINYELAFTESTSILIHAISLGNPHAVLVVNRLSDSILTKYGLRISKHRMFPEECNAGFMQIIDANHIKLRVFERGCGETKACGSGAVAAAAIGQLYYQLDNQVKVSLEGGDLYVNWPDKQGPIYLTGPATFVYEGVLNGID